ncbi:sugar ABC transporter substrate-binding protein [Microbacterium sp. C23T]
MTRFTRVTARTVAVGALAAATVMTLVGCTRGGDASGDTTSRTIGIVDFDTTAPITAEFSASTKTALEKAGIEVLTQDPKGESAQANNICAQYVTRQVDAIVINIFAPDQLAQCISQADAAGIPLFYIGAPLTDGMAGAVNTAAPAPVNELFGQFVEDEAIDAVLALDYSPGTPCRLRAEARTSALDGLDVSVDSHEFPIPGQVVDAQNATAAWLAAHPEGSGNFAIWACYADPTTGALAALAQVGRTDVVLYTWDYNDSLRGPIEEGRLVTLSVNGTAVGGQMADIVVRYLDDGETTGEDAANTILDAGSIAEYLAGTK